MISKPHRPGNSIASPRSPDIGDAERVLEIGCGWGALATRLAAQHPQAQIDGITISPSQLEWARAAVDRAGVADRVALELRDYRDLSGRYDRIVSIEMFEAVGEAYWPQFFRQIESCLADRGHAVMQVITISEDRYAGYRSGVDFIQRYIFPGGFLPSKTCFAAAAAAAGLTVVHDENFGTSYARTVAEWRRRFHANWDAIAAQGFDERFKRLWDYYLCYCEAGFLEGTIDVGLYVLTRADAPFAPPINR